MQAVYVHKLRKRRLRAGKWDVFETLPMVNLDQKTAFFGSLNQVAKKKNTVRVHPNLKPFTYADVRAALHTRLVILPSDLVIWGLYPR